MADSDPILSRARRAIRTLRGDGPAPAPTPSSSPTPSAGAKVRLDTTNAAGGTRTGSAIANPVSGLGGVQDSGALARPELDRDYLSTEELVALLRGGPYRRICQLLPWEGTRRGFTLTDDTDEASPLHQELRTHRVLRKVRQASTWARALSEARLWLLVDDGRPQSEPLRIDRVRRFAGAHILDVREFTPASWQTNPATATELGWPETYHIHPRRPGVQTPTSAVVHHTRLLRFIGDELPPSEMGFSSGSNRAYGCADAVGQTIWDALRNVSQTNAAGAKLAQELSVFVLHMDKFPAMDTGRARDVLRASLRVLMQVRGLVNGFVLGTNDKVERLGANASGFKDISEDNWQFLQAVVGIPAPLLRMQTPGGLNTDGQSWQTGWYGSSVPAWQEEHLRDPLEVIVQCLYMATLGAIPDTWKLTFNPLQEPTPLERAQVYLTTAQADRIALEDGLLTHDQVRRSRYAEGGFQLDLQPPTEEEVEAFEAEGAGAMSLEEAETELAQLLAGRAGGSVAEGGAGAPAGATPATPAAPAPSTEAPPERLNGAQLKSAQEILAAAVEKSLTPEAAALLLSEVVGEQKAQALVRAQRGAQAPNRDLDRAAAPAPKQDKWHIDAERSMPDVLLDRLYAGEVTWDVAVGALDADLPASVRKMRIKVPAFMQRNAELGMELRERFGRGMPAPEGGGAATGAETASDLKSGEIGAARVLLMAAWFARHFAPEQLKAKRQAEGWQDPEAPSNGWIAALGWGDKGDGRAKAWVERQAKRVRKAIKAAEEREDADFEGKALISARLSAKGVQRWRELLRQVEPITGRLQGYDPDDDGIQEDPHVTVLYLGAIEPEALDEVAEAMQKEAEGWRPEVLHVRRIKTLPGGPVSGERTPIVAEVNAWSLHELHHQLLRRLAHLVRAKQFPRYEQHVTLGFAPELDGDALVALEELIPRASDFHGPEAREDLPEPMGAIGELVLTYGGKVVARAPFVGRRDAKPPQDQREDGAPVGNEVEFGGRGAGEE